jgi:hypothetical protein
MTERVKVPGVAHLGCAGWILSVIGISLGLSCSTSPSAAAPPAPAAAPSAGSAPVTACGSKGLPDCPLQAWMKATLQAYLTAGDTARLATALDELASHPPDGFANWSATAKAGADAARGGDVAKVRAECQTCHEEHRTVFRKQIRTARLF